MSSGPPGQLSQAGSSSAGQTSAVVAGANPAAEFQIEVYGGIGESVDSGRVPLLIVLGPILAAFAAAALALWVGRRG